MQLRPHQQRALTAMQKHKFGQIIVPTGGGKTMIMIKDLARRFANAERPLTVAVVAPRILLATNCAKSLWKMLTSTVLMLCLLTSTVVRLFTSRLLKANKIAAFDTMCQTMQAHRIFFTTYNSLRRLNEAGMSFDVAYFDEAHNATKRTSFLKLLTVMPSVTTISLPLPSTLVLLLATA